MSLMKVQLMGERQNYHHLKNVMWCNQKIFYMIFIFSIETILISTMYQRELLIPIYFLHSYFLVILIAVAQSQGLRQVAHQTAQGGVE